MKMNKRKAPIKISAEKLYEFEGHPFKVVYDDEMKTLIESIQTHGILSPLIVRPLENTSDEYEIISGHRRLWAAQKAGLETVPAFVFDVSRDEAAIMVVDSNLHREHILPSEKAFAYKLKMEAMSRQGARTDLTSGQVGTKLRTDELIAENSDDSARQVQRYIRLTNLIPKLLDLLDEGKIAFSVGVELSYLSDDMQYVLLDQIEALDCTPSYAQANHMHRDFVSGTLTEERISEMMTTEKPNQRETVKIPAERLRSVLPSDYDAKKTEDFIIKACEHYKRYLQKKRELSR